MGTARTYLSTICRASSRRVSRSPNRYFPLIGLQLGHSRFPVHESFPRIAQNFDIAELLQLLLHLYPKVYVLGHHANPTIVTLANHLIIPFYIPTDYSVSRQTRPSQVSEHGPSSVLRRRKVLSKEVSI